MIRWANLKDNNMYTSSSQWMARIFHDDGVTPYDNEGLDMHTHCIPYPKHAKEFYVNDFVILHVEGLKQGWSTDKQVFYQCVDYDKNQRSPIVLDRMYNRVVKEQLLSIPPAWYYTKEQHGFDVLEVLDCSETNMFNDRVLAFFDNKGIKHYARLNIWSQRFLSRNNLKDPRSWWIKGMHWYLRCTRKYTQTIVIRVIDKILKTIVKYK